MRRLTVPVCITLVLALAVAIPGPARAATIRAKWPVLRAPLGLATDPATGKVYVSNSETVAPDGTGRVSVVDPATGLVASITTTLSANFVLADPSARRLYSSNSTHSGDKVSLDVFDLDTGAMLASLAVGGIGLALDSAAGRLYVGGRSLAVVDTSTLTVVATKPGPLNGAWFDVAVDPGRHHLYLTTADETRPVLVVADDRDLSTLAEVPFATALRFALAVDPTDQRIYIAGSDPKGPPFPGSAFYVLDPDTFATLHATSVPGFPMGLALAPARHRIYVTDGSGWRVYALDDTTFDVAETIGGLNFEPGPPLFHADGRLYMGNYNTLATFDSTLVALDLANHAPVIASVAFSPSTPRTNDIVQAIVAAYDPDLPSPGQPDPTVLTYQWSRNGVPIGATGSSLDLSVAGNGDRGDTISVTVTASDGQLSSTASASVVVADSAPTVSVTLEMNAPATNLVVTATAVGADADGDVLTYSFTWKINGLVRKTASGPNTSDSFDLGVAGNGDHGDTLVVEVTASDGTLVSGAASASATIVNSAPTVGVSLNTTKPTTRTVLVATAAGQDLDRDPLTFTYTWRLNGVVRRTTTTSATTDSYDLSVKGNGSNEDVITVSVIASDGTLASGPASASATVTPGKS